MSHESTVQRVWAKTIMRMHKPGHYREIRNELRNKKKKLRKDWGLDIVWVREKGLEVYSLIILSSLALAVTVHNDCTQRFWRRNKSSRRG